MSPRTRQPRVVAELGRPETPEETAARKAENSRNHRMRKTVNNLVLSLLVTVGLVIVIVLAVPRSDTSLLGNVDVAAVAADAQQSQSESLANPVLPEGWRANRAELAETGGVSTWNIGLITPKPSTGTRSEQFIGITQGFEANETWLAGELKNSIASDTTTIDGITWTVYDNRATTSDVGNVHYALTTEAGDSTFILFGTANDAEFETVAKAIAPQVEANLKGDE